jgi:hypothetical protein
MRFACTGLPHERILAVEHLNAARQLILDTMLGESL